MRTFYVLSAVQVLSAIGSGMTAIAVGIWLFAQTGETTPVLLVVFFSSLPQMIGGAFTGLFIDRWSKRRVLILANTGQAVGTLVLLLSLMSGRFQVWHLYAISLWQGSFGMVQAPTMLALITTIVLEPLRERANTIQQMTNKLAGIIAPMLAGVAYAGIGVIGVVVIDLITFICAVVVTYWITVQGEKHQQEPSSTRATHWRDLTEGIRFLVAQRGLFWLIIHGTVINFFLSSVLSLVTPYVLTITNSEATLGIVLGALNVGSIVGAAVIAVWGGTRPRIHTIMPAVMCISAAVIGYGLAQTIPALVVTALLMLLPMPMVTSLISAIVQTKTPLPLQGRVFAAIFQLASFANPIALLLTGPLVDHVLTPAVGALAGMRLMIVSAGVMMFGITVLFYLNTGIRRVEV